MPYYVANCECEAPPGTPHRTTYCRPYRQHNHEKSTQFGNDAVNHMAGQYGIAGNQIRYSGFRSNVEKPPANAQEI